jgi:hypothetical protein
MFGRRQKFEPDGFYDGYGYRAVNDGKIDVDLDGKIVRFNSVEEIIARLARADVPQVPAAEVAPPISVAIPTPMQMPPPEVPLPPALKKKRSGCGCLTLILIAFAIFYLASGNSDGSKIADIINSQFGRVCEAKVEGVFSNTLRLDWTAATTKLHVITVMAAIGQSKETLYSKGIRYLKFPNDSGGYNIIDWKTGEKSSVDERARYHF